VKRLLAPFTASLLAVAIGSPALATGTFTSVDPGKIYSLSSDGSTMVGESGNTATKWDTTLFGSTSLGVLGGDTISVAWDVSGDGSVVVGESGTKIWDPILGGENTAGYTGVGTFDDAQGVVWSGGGATALAGLTGSAGITGAHGISADGTTVVGSSSENYNPWDAVAGENGRAEDLAYDPTRFNFAADGTPIGSPYDPSTHINDQTHTGVIWDISGGAGSATAMDVGLSPRFGGGTQYDPAFDPGEPISGSGTPGDPWVSVSYTHLTLPTNRAV